MMKLTHVVGARPNFMKAAPVMAALAKYSGVSQTLVHTGQHYDHNMSQIFFEQLGLPKADINLGVGSASHAVQTAQIMLAFERVMVENRPNWVIVYGDVNSTVATALVCSKLHIPICHVEAGLRSFDRTMPEEINRILTDQLADLLFTPSADGDQNLLNEGIPTHKIKLVGNVMIDTLVRLLPDARAGWSALRERLALSRYGLVTLHRPASVDDPAVLARLLTALNEIGQQLPLLFPIHPRTRARIERVQLSHHLTNIQLCEPLGYLEFLALQENAELVITDSGGIQEETTFLGVPCLTMRENTERPITITHGTNRLIGLDTDLLRHAVDQILQGGHQQGEIPPLWDGKAGERIAQLIVDTA